MTTKHNSDLESLADDIRALGNNLRFNIGIQLLSSGLLINKYINMKYTKPGHSRSRFEVLYTLTTHGGTLKPSDLSELLFRSKQTITQVIDGLERDGLVKRKLKGKDRRTKSITIVSKGIDVVRESLVVTLDINNSAIPKLTKAETQALQSALKKIRTHLIKQIYNTTQGR